MQSVAGRRHYGLLGTTDVQTLHAASVIEMTARSIFGSTAGPCDIDRTLRVYVAITCATTDNLRYPCGGTKFAICLASRESLRNRCIRSDLPAVEVKNILHECSDLDVQDRLEEFDGRP